MSGVQTANVYAGGPLTSFAWHIEDGNLSSINYLHRGAPKHWYHIPTEFNEKLEELSVKLSKKMKCDKFIRHKSMMIPPSVLEKNQIPFGWVCDSTGFLFH